MSDVLIRGRLYVTLWPLAHAQYVPRGAWARLWIAEPGPAGFTAWRRLRGAPDSRHRWDE